MKDFKDNNLLEYNFNKHQTIKKEDGHICAEADVTWASVKNNAPARLPKEFIVDGLRP